MKQKMLFILTRETDGVGSVVLQVLPAEYSMVDEQIQYMVEREKLIAVVPQDKLNN